MTEYQLEHSAEGVHYIDDDSSADKATVRKIIKQIPPHGRQLRVGPDPIIYVNDGSNGSNLKNTYSYPVYNRGGPPSVRNGYSNNYPNSQQNTIITDHVNPGNLHPTGDQGGYSDYTISYRVK